VGESKKQVLHVFIARDERSAVLVSTLQSILREIEENKRPKIKLHVVKIRDPEDFPAYLARLEEIFGGLYTSEFKKYGITKLPTIVYKGQKIIEGIYPTEDELRQILAYEGIIVKRKIKEPVPKAVSITPPTEVKIQRDEIRYPIEDVKTEGYIKPEVTPQEPYIYRPTADMQQLSQEQEQSYTPIVGKKELISKEYEKQAEVQESAQVSLTEEPYNFKLEKSTSICGSCIFYQANSNRCMLLHVTVSDPNNPPCGRRYKS